jgi:hypothetical protein
MINIDVSSIEESLVVWIRIREEDKGSKYNDSIQLWSLVDIYNQIHSTGDCYGLHMHRSEFTAPSGVIRPERGIGECYTLSGNIASSSDVNMSC